MVDSKIKNQAINELQKAKEKTTIYSFKLTSFSHSSVPVVFKLISNLADLLPVTTLRVPSKTLVLHAKNHPF